MERASKKLGDAPDRSYASKLELFTRFAAPELSRIFAGLRLPSRGTALDLGCGTGLATSLLANALGPDVVTVGLDLSLPHLHAARRQHGLPLLQCDAEQLALNKESFDFIWSCNTINHMADRIAVLESLRRCLRGGGHLALAQSSLIPEMYFAWDVHLEDAVREACHRYYREKYGLDLSDTADIRANLGPMRAAGFDDIEVRTHVIERTQPLSQTDREYFQTAVADGFWGEKIRPFLESESFSLLESYCSPASEDYWLDRSDFHHIQTVTVFMGAVPT